MPAKTNDTITDVDELLEELVEIRDQGYAICDEEAIQGIRAVGAPILDDEGEVEGAISASGPKQQFHDELLEEALPQTVMEIANVIEVNLTTRDSSRVLRYKGALSKRARTSLRITLVKP